jgi:hypothetical protein
MPIQLRSLSSNLQTRTHLPLSFPSAQTNRAPPELPPPISRSWPMSLRRSGTGVREKSGRRDERGRSLYSFRSGVSSHPFPDLDFASPFNGVSLLLIFVYMVSSDPDLMIIQIMGKRLRGKSSVNYIEIYLDPDPI